MEKILELPVEIGAVVYDSDFPQYPMRVIGYRIGRMMNEDEEDFEEDLETDELYVEYEGCGMSVSSPASEFGRRIFLTSKEAEQVSSENKDMDADTKKMLERIFS